MIIKDLISIKYNQYQVTAHFASFQYMKKSFFVLGCHLWLSCIENPLAVKLLDDRLCIFVILFVRLCSFSQTVKINFIVQFKNALFHWFLS